jgi:hypothetical protein
MKPFLLSAAAMAALAGIALLFDGCANTTTTKVYRDANGAWVVESPKDIHAQGVDYQNTKGEHLQVQDWQSHVDPNVTAAQGTREAGDVDATANLVGNAVAAAVKGQMAPMATPAK